MKKLEIIEMLNKSIKSKNQVHIVRKRIDNNPIDGVPLNLGEKLLLIQYIYDFQLDGYKIIRLKDISSIRVGECESFYEYILKEEGIYNQICIPLIDALDSWENVIKDLKALGRNIIIECENNIENSFFIGKIIDINKKSVSLLCFNPIGQWDETITQVAYSEISSISFEDRYTNTISKYLK